MTAQTDMDVSLPKGGAVLPGPVANADSTELVPIVLAALNAATFQYARLMGRVERFEPIRTADIDSSRAQVEHALALLAQLAGTVRTESTVLDALLRGYATEWLARSGVAGVG